MTRAWNAEESTPAEIVRRAIEAKGGKKALKQEWGRRTFGGRNRKASIKAIREASRKANSPGGKSYAYREECRNEAMKRRQEEEEITKRTSRELQLRRAAQGDIAACDDGPTDILGSK